MVPKGLFSFSDWRRFVSLGASVLMLASFSLTAAFKHSTTTFGDGIIAIYAGSLIVIVLVKMNRTVNIKYILVGVPRIISGALVVTDPQVTGILRQLIFGSSFGLGAIGVVLLGRALPGSGGRAWLTASGMASATCLLGWYADRHLGSASLTSDFLLGTDLLILGIAIIGAGFSLKKKH